jgi:transcriptional regulator with XRE-family HTH domain
MARLKLKELAEARGLNISQLARRSGLDIQMVRRYWYNRGMKGPLEEVNLAAIDRIAEVLGVSPGELFTHGEEDTEEIDMPALALA